jgi:hypothetical protein
VPGAVPVDDARWPKVIGIVSIVFGSLGVLTGCSAIASGFMMSLFMGVMPADARNQPAMVAMRDWAPWTGAVGAAKSIVAVGLLVGGILLLQKKRGGARLLVAWAIARMAVAVFDTAVTYFMQSQVMATAAGQANTPPPGVPPGFFTMMAAFSAVFALAWGCALPIFVLVWLNLPFARAEVDRWRARAGSAA